MNKNITTLILIFSFFSCVRSNAQNYNLFWDKTFGGDSRDWSSVVSTNISGDIFIIGDSQSDISGDKNSTVCNTLNPNSDIWMLKIDVDGNILWQKDIGSDSDERLPRLFHLNNGNKEMLFSCFTASNIACDKTEPNRDTIPLLTNDYWLCLLDSNGTVVWNKTLGGDNYDDYTQITQLTFGEFLIGGESNSPAGYDKTIPNYSISNDMWVVKLDNTGNILWNNVFGGDGAEYLVSIIPDIDGSFLLAGSSSSDVSGDVSQTSQGSLDYWVIKVDNAGNKIWDKRYGGSGVDKCNYAVRTSDNGYLLCGYTVSPLSGDVSEAPKGIQDYWVVKIDSAGNKLWDKRYGGNGGSFGTWAAAANGSGYWIGGYSNSSNVIDVSEPSYGGSDYWLLKIDDSGNKLWDKKFGGSADDYFSSMLIGADSTMMAFGYSDSGSSAIKTAPSKGWMDYWMVKFSYTDSTTGLSHHPELISEMKILPNPTNGVSSLELNLTKSTDAKLEILDASGKVILRSEYTFDQGYQIVQLETDKLEAGYYFVRILTVGGSKVKKLVIIR